MNFRAFILSLILLTLTAPIFARDKTDILVMKNGDRMTCEVKGLDAGVLYASFDYIDGTTSVDWSKVARLESTRLFVVRTEDGSVYTGALKTAESGVGRPIKIEVLATPEREVIIEQSRIVNVVATSERFWERFNGEVSFGVIYSKGNQSTQYSLGSDTLYVRENWDAGATFDSNLSSSAGVAPSTRNSLSLIGRHLLPPKNWFYAGLGGLLESSEQGISLQSVVGGGVGRYVKNTNRASIQLLGGGAWQDTTYQRSIVPVGKQSTAAALIYAKGSFFKFSKTKLDATAAILPSLSDPGRVRIDTNAAYYIKIISDLKWNVSFYGNWDNRPPPGFSGSDYGTSSGLSWTFGLK